MQHRKQGDKDDASLSKPFAEGIKHTDLPDPCTRALHKQPSHGFPTRYYINLAVAWPVLDTA